MTSMGQLAVELSNSVSFMHDMKNSTILCTKFTYKCKKRAIMLIMAFFICLACSFFVLTSYDWIIWEPWNNTVENPFDHNFMTNKIYSYFNFVVYTPLVLTVTYYYICMRTSLNTCTSSVLANEKR